ncbi:MAG: hypothetical protein ACR2HR_14610 [Euzebya sp.]
MTLTLSTATWTHQRQGRYVLVDGSGYERGTYERSGRSMRQATATIEGVPINLTGRGVLNRTLVASDSGGQQVAQIEVSGLSWGGRVTLSGAGPQPISRRIGLPVTFTVGDPDSPLLVMGMHHRRAEMTFLAQLPQHHPALLPLMLLLMQHHANSGSQL